MSLLQISVSFKLLTSWINPKGQFNVPKFHLLSYQGDVMLQIRVWGRSEDKLKKCVDDIKASLDSDIPVTAYPVLSEAVSGADVVATVTMSSEPVLHGEWVKPGALVCCKCHVLILAGINFSDTSFSKSLKFMVCYCTFQ